MYNEFVNPSNRFRPIPFWSWNGQLEKDELEYQIEEMKKAGVGGYFMHARSGLKTEYLSEEWFECVRSGIQKGKEVDMDVWAYDEEGWPSGFAGGLVPAMSTDFHAKFITLSKCHTTVGLDKENVFALYLYKEDEEKCRKIDILTDYTCSQGEELLAIVRHSNSFYIDTMNKRAVDAFIQCTHEAYYEKFGDEFGSHMKGFFTDEPRFTCDHFGELPWSDGLPAEFLSQYGYDLTDHLPALYLSTSGFEKYRYDFWRLVNRLFAQNYMKNIYDWCDLHDCKLTGHIMMEESIFSQMTSTGGVMPLYEYFHVPGIDWLRRRIDSPVIGKQVGSAACQLGKKQVLTESFALCGWDVSFEELKWIAEWQFVNGVNQICQHLEAYTIKGERKRDYPPSLFIQQTWWDEYKKFNDYLARLCVVLSEGDQTADVLVLHPMQSGFITYDGTRTDEIRMLDDAFTKTCEALSGSHISYHLGDETIIERHGKVDGKNFVVGIIPYRTVIMPCMHAVSTHTVQLLLHFIKNGGHVFSLGRFPTFTNENPALLEELKNSITFISIEEVREKMITRGLVSLSIEENGQEISSISYQQRETKDKTILFMVNHSRECAFAASVTVHNKSYRVNRWAAESGTIQSLSYDTRGGGTHFNLTFEPMQSYIVVLSDSPADLSHIEPSLPQRNVTLSHEWNIDQMDLNSMTLDFCTYRIDGRDWQGPAPIIKIQKELLDLKMPCEVELRFEFRIDMDLSGSREFYAVVEDAQLYEIQVNGTYIPYTDIGFWKDKSFRKIDIRKHLTNKDNELILKISFRQPQKVYDVLYGENVYETQKNKITFDIELENIYLLGDFGVVSESPYREMDRNAWVTDGPFVIAAPPTGFTHSNFTLQGLAFFAGRVQVSQEMKIIRTQGERIVLEYGRHRSSLVKIYINGHLVKDSMWAPYSADITDYLTDGENRVSLELFASNRNLFGPHHHIDGESIKVGPSSFTGEWSWVERTSEADATEIFDRSKNYWTDSYCFVSFGI